MWDESNKEQLKQDIEKWHQRFRCHKFLTLAFASGASTIVVERKMEEFLERLPKDESCFFIIEKDRLGSFPNVHVLIGKAKDPQARDSALRAVYYVSNFKTPPSSHRGGINSIVLDLT